MNTTTPQAMQKCRAKTLNIIQTGSYFHLHGQEYITSSQHIGIYNVDDIPTTNKPILRWQNTTGCRTKYLLTFIKFTEQTMKTQIQLTTMGGFGLDIIQSCPKWARKGEHDACMHAGWENCFENICQRWNIRSCNWMMARYD